MGSKDTEAETYNRLFIIGPRGCEDVYRSEFAKYGNVTNILFTKDKKTGEDKGIVYVTYEKVSEAMLALEEANGTYITESSTKPIKVLLASDHGKDSRDDKFNQIFIRVPKEFVEKDVADAFQEYGKIVKISIVKDRETGLSRGLAFVRFTRSYYAGLALEGCDKSFKARFALEKKSESDGGGGRSNPREGREQRPKKRERDDGRRGGMFTPPTMGGMGPPMLPPTPSFYGMGSGPGGPGGPANCELEAFVVKGLAYQQVHHVFDIPPGLEAFDYDPHTGIACARYTNGSFAEYARKKIDRFEYPIGSFIAVRFASGMGGMGGPPGGAASKFGASLYDLSENIRAIGEGSGGNADLQALQESIRAASELLDQARMGGGAGVGPNAGMGMGMGGGSGMGMGGGNSMGNPTRSPFCDFPLPPCQPLATTKEFAERLFFVTQPFPIPEHVMQDVLCRFGGLINVFFQIGKNFGYAKFANKESAERAIVALHGKEIYGARIKIMKAEPRRMDLYKQQDREGADKTTGEDEDAKRARWDSN